MIMDEHKQFWIDGQRALAGLIREKTDGGRLIVEPLLNIIRDPRIKKSIRLDAAKAVLSYAGQFPDLDRANTLKVVSEKLDTALRMESVPPEMLQQEKLAREEQKKQRANENSRIGLSKKLRFTILEKYHYRCVYCGATAEKASLEVDHVYPYSKGGGDNPSNLVVACEQCNSGKNARVLMENPPAWKRPEPD
jgi:5-methylcytosine-specific restriction endonuclease McrA